MEFAAAGMLLGLAGGIGPGPLLTLVVVESLRGGARRGVMVSLAPLVTDGPIALVAIFVMSRVGDLDRVLGAIALAGAAIIVYFVWENLRLAPSPSPGNQVAGNALKKGMLINLLNPHPYMFWFAVGAPTVVVASHKSALAAGGFLVAFYGLLIGAKIAVALLVGRWRGLVSGRPYVILNRLLAAALMVFAVKIFIEGLRLLGVIPGLAN